MSRTVSFPFVPNPQPPSLLPQRSSVIWLKFNKRVWKLWLILLLQSFAWFLIKVNMNVKKKFAPVFAIICFWLDLHLRTLYTRIRIRYGSGDLIVCKASKRWRSPLYYSNVYLRREWFIYLSNSFSIFSRTSVWNK